MFASIYLFADDPPASPFGGGMLIPFVIIIAFFLIMTMRRSSVQNRERQAMLNALEKNDKVLTIGGIYGTVVMVSPTEDEVTVKVDDNTRVKITKASVARNITKEQAAAAPKAETPASTTAVTTKPNS